MVRNQINNGISLLCRNGKLSITYSLSAREKNIIMGEVILLVYGNTAVIQCINQFYEARPEISKGNKFVKNINTDISVGNKILPQGITWFHETLIK